MTRPLDQERDFCRPDPSWSHRQEERGSVWSHPCAVPREPRYILRHFQRFLSLGYSLFVHVVLPVISSWIDASCPALPFHHVTSRTFYFPNPRVYLCARSRGDGTDHTSGIYRARSTHLLRRVPCPDEEYYMRTAPYWCASRRISGVATGACQVTTPSMGEVRAE